MCVYVRGFARAARANQPGGVREQGDGKDPF